MLLRIRGITAIVFSALAAQDFCEVRGADDAAAMLTVMRENDARFDGVVLKDTRTWDAVLKPRRPRVFNLEKNAPRQPADYWQQVEYKGVAHETFIVKGRNRVLSVDFDKSMAQADKYRRIGTGFTRTGDFRGIVYRFDDSQLPDGDSGKTLANYERQLRIQPFKYELGALYDTMLGREFTHGIGFGRRIEEVTSYEREVGVHRLKGRIKIWNEDVSTFEIEVDDHGLVRQATVDCDVKGNRTRFVSTSEGIVESDGLKIAQSGHFERLRPAKPTSVDQRSTVVSEFDLEAVSLETNVDDATFEKLSRFELQPLMQYDNFIDKLHGTCIELEDGSVALKLRSREVLSEVPDHRGL